MQSKKSEKRIQSLLSHLMPSQFATTLAPPDAIFELSASYKADKDPNKINLGVGAYRDNQGNPWILPVVKKVKNHINFM
jgi:aspartate aminotransferase